MLANRTLLIFSVICSITFSPVRRGNLFQGGCQVLYPWFVLSKDRIVRFRTHSGGISENDDIHILEKAAYNGGLARVCARVFLLHGHCAAVRPGALNGPPSRRALETERRTIDHASL